MTLKESGVREMRGVPSVRPRVRGSSPTFDQSARIEQCCGVPENPSSQPTAAGPDRFFTALIVGYVLYGCAFIYRTRFVEAGVRYFSLFDDEIFCCVFPTEGAT